MSEFKKTTIETPSIHHLIDDAINNMHISLQLESVRSRDKLRIAVPEPLLKLLFDEHASMMQHAEPRCSNGVLKYRNIRIIENYQFNITVFHVDWYLINQPGLVQTFNIKPIS